MAHPTDVPTLTGEAVVLRALDTADVTRIVEQCNDEDTLQWTTIPRPYTTDDAHTFLASVQSAWRTGSGLLGFAIEARETPGVYLGTISLEPSSPSVAEVGYVLHPDGRGRGLATDALKTVCQWWFENGGTAVTWKAYVGNVGSLASALKVGFTLDPGTRRSGGVTHDGLPTECYTGSLRAGEPMERQVRIIKPEVLSGEGLVLRPWRDDDVMFVEAPNTPAHFVPPGATPTRETFASWLARRRATNLRGEGVNWAITDAESGQVFGDVLLFGRDFPAAVELGYFVFPSAAGKQVASRAATLVSDWALASPDDGGLGAKCVTASYMVDNYASGRVLSRAGFHPTGQAFLPGGFGDGTASTLLTMQRTTHDEFPVTVTAATPADWRRLRALRVRSLAEDAASFGGRLSDTLTYDDAEWQNRLARPGHFMAVQAGLDVGLIRVAEADDNPTLWHVFCMWVDPTMRGRGVAADLLDAGEHLARARGATHMELGVMESATAARGMYASCGYQEVGTDGGCGGASCDIIMRKALA